LGAIFPSLVAPTPAPTRHTQSAKALLPLVVNQQYEWLRRLSSSRVGPAIQFGIDSRPFVKPA
jgi:hypothetical protein